MKRIILLIILAFACPKWYKKQTPKIQDVKKLQQKFGKNEIFGKLTKADAG